MISWPCNLPMYMERLFPLKYDVFLESDLKYIKKPISIILYIQEIFCTILIFLLMKIPFKIHIIKHKVYYSHD